MRLKVVVMMVVPVLAVGCQKEKGSEAADTSPPPEKMSVTITVTSPAFEEGGMIPPEYTCDGADISPPLTFGNIPEDAQSLALIVDDPDAPTGTWVHWVLYNVPAITPGLPPDVPPDETLAFGARQGMTNFGSTGYGGPCPPDGTHRYFFKVYALDSELGFPDPPTKANLEEAMAGHILAEGQLMGKYTRQ